MYRGETLEDRTSSELETLVEALEDGEGSALVLNQPEAMRAALRRRRLENGRVFLPAAEGEVEIRGWLEAPWSDAAVLCLSGCREGSLPSGTHEDAFLPDSLRARLGLASDASRYARDAYLLSCLLNHYGPDHLRLGYSRFGPDGEPNRPSRLLFGCDDAELPARVQKIFQPSPVRNCSAKAPSAWKLHLDRPEPVTSIRVTGFKHYLECPLRFYLSQVKRLQPFDPDTREINAADYGTLLQRVLENFHKKGPAQSTDEHAIAGWLDKELDRIIAWHFGRQPSPVIRVQAESMRVRLRYFAALQAAERRDGWQIIESEYAVKQEDGFTIGPLVLSGTMDRVERHEEKGLRILDYKTFANEKSPEETHFGPPRDADDLAEASITRQDARGRNVDRSWIDLQLPLYRRLAAKKWPQESPEKIQTGYLLLPGDPDDTQISLLDIDVATQNQAEACAEAVAERIAAGVFWPPSSKVKYDSFADWFNGEDPREVFDEATAVNLGGDS
ncbi:MAG: PD-(D/E)XK nuclease family protein [Chthoniobacterales bacterium]